MMEEAVTGLVEVGASFAQAYAPVLDFDGWRIAMLRHFSVVSPSTFHRVERHRNTNEVFILTAGSADLILCEGNERPEAPRVILMTRNVAYNVRKSVWHHVVLSPEAHMVLFERSDTGPETTDYANLTPADLAAVRARFSVSEHA
jgi:ureidoglycolate hydrolase